MAESSDGPQCPHCALVNEIPVDGDDVYDVVCGGCGQTFHCEEATLLVYYSTPVKEAHRPDAATQTGMYDHDDVN